MIIGTALLIAWFLYALYLMRKLKTKPTTTQHRYRGKP